MEGWDEAEIPDDDAVPARLTELGLPDIRTLHRAIRDGQAAGDFCTAAHPVYYAGSRVHCETNGSLRLQLAHMGWSFNDDDNIARAISPDGSVVVTALRVDEQTGMRTGAAAQTRRPRKTASVRIIKHNRSLQLTFLEMLETAEESAV